MLVWQSDGAGVAEKYHSLLEERCRSPWFLAPATMIPAQVSMILVHVSMVLAQVSMVLAQVRKNIASLRHGKCADS